MTNSRNDFNALIDQKTSLGFMIVVVTDPGAAKIDLTERQSTLIDELKIHFVAFNPDGDALYRYQEEAIAVAQRLVDESGGKLVLQVVERYLELKQP